MGVTAEEVEEEIRAEVEEEETEEVAEDRENLRSYREVKGNDLRFDGFHDDTTTSACMAFCVA